MMTETDRTASVPADAPGGAPGGPPPGSARGCTPVTLLGLIGAGIQASRTPAMHEAEAARQGFRLSYRLLDAAALPRGPADFATLLRAAELCGFAGVNVTHPFKVEALAHVDALSEAAARIGAVNTIVLQGGRRVGHNTDHWGFAEAFARGLPGVARERVLLIGAGGAGVAVAHALLDRGVRGLVLVDAEGARAEALAARLAPRYPGVRIETAPDPAAAAAGGLDGVVNATPLGMAGHPGSPFPARLLGPGLWVADIVYFPRETELLAAARAAGARVLDGAGMAVFQAVEAFRLFTGRPADPAAMRATFERLEG